MGGGPGPAAADLRRGARRRLRLRGGRPVWRRSSGAGVGRLSRARRSRRLCRSAARNERRGVGGGRAGAAHTARPCDGGRAERGRARGAAGRGGDGGCLRGGGADAARAGRGGAARALALRGGWRRRRRGLFPRRRRAPRRSPAPARRPAGRAAAPARPAARSRARRRPALPPAAARRRLRSPLRRVPRVRGGRLGLGPGAPRRGLAPHAHGAALPAGGLLWRRPPLLRRRRGWRWPGAAAAEARRRRPLPVGEAAQRHPADSGLPSLVCARVLGGGRQCIQSAQVGTTVVARSRWH
mmetsp:Transcript_31576/g.99009  ORF Transcript_31576/g.99009 Transcript_31576/m.99009 type:complete len:297 (-) Transcript_31576:67-957(-)